MRKTLLLALLLIVTAAAAAGSWSYYVWNHSDELLRTQLHDRLETLFPGWNMSIARARFDFQGRIHAYGFRLTTGEDRQRFVDADEVILTVDGGRLADVDPLIRRIEFVRPRVWLVRDSQGDWNFRKLPPIKLPPGVLPAWTLDRLSVSTRIERGGGLPALLNDIDDAQLQLTPVGRRQYRLKLAGRSNLADVAKLEGTWHLDAKSWQVQANLGRLKIDDKMFILASEFSPEFRGALARAMKAIRDRITQPIDPIEEESSESAGEFDLGVLVTSDVEMRLKQESPGGELEYSASMQILDGEMARPPIDFPLSELRGRASLDNQKILFEQLTARSGGIGLSLPSGKIEEQDDLRPARFEFHLTEIPLDDRIVGLLPAVPRKLYLEARPTGKVDAHLSIETDGASPWSIEWTLNPRDCTARHVEFPYLVEGVEGEVSQRDGVIRAELKGIAGRQPMRMFGETTNPGPEAESNYEIVVDGLPIDARLREAAPPPLQKVIDVLQVQGTIGGRVMLKRPRGPKQPTIPTVDVTLRNATITPKVFPYTLNRASARIRGSGKSWKFTNCKAWHDRTVITGSGEYRPDEDQIPRLKLKFSADDLRFDRTLYEALPDDLRSLWYEVNPEGSAHIVEGNLDWTPGSGVRPRVELEAELLDASVALRSFPYHIRNIHAWANVAPGKVTIRDFEGRHDETRFRTQAEATVTEDGEWRFRCEPLTVDDLDAGMAFRRALPGALRTVVDAFDLRGGVSISGMLELRGVRGDDYPVTAAWNLKTVYTGNSVTAGVELQEMHGKSQFSGTWDGEAVRRTTDREIH
ncbi:MAG: hypothetical protein NT069_34520 [Planctomycetota bacterium]|nr:hypothetical protein [Planctomycetota bacterium]